MVDLISSSSRFTSAFVLVIVVVTFNIFIYLVTYTVIYQITVHANANVADNRLNSKSMQAIRNQ